MTMWAEQSGRRLQATEGGLGGNQTYRALLSEGSPEAQEVSVALASQFVAFWYCSSSKVIQ